MTDRDTFAAAALTGLIVCMKDETCGEICESAYWWADNMLRERGAAVSDNCVTSNHREMECPVAEQGPAAWATFYPNGSTASVYIGRVPPHAVPLYRHPQPKLTDGEREAVLAAACYFDTRADLRMQEHGSTLRKLLERLT